MNLRITAILSGIIVFSALAVAACQPSPAPTQATPTGVGATATAMLAGPDGAALGMVTLTQTPLGVLVAAEVNGLPAGGHGFHIHETGACAPDFAAAGDHFNPTDAGHGFNNLDGMHAGDLPNLYAGADGMARADYFTAAITLDADADHSVFDADGSAIIIHEKPDTYGADAGAGGRIACGVIQRN